MSAKFAIEAELGFFTLGMPRRYTFEALGVEFSSGSSHKARIALKAVADDVCSLVSFESISYRQRVLRQLSLRADKLGMKLVAVEPQAA